MAYVYRRTKEEAAPLPLARAGRIVALTLTGVLFVVAGVLAWTLLTQPAYASLAGENFAIYRDAATRWLAGGPYVLPDQLTGPYTVLEGHVLYPPVALILFVPFAYLPAPLWWAIPIGIVAWHVVTCRPTPWGWTAIAACVAFPMTVQNIHSGNPVMWIAAAFALSFRWPWVGVFVLLKPSLFPFALGGIRTRAWWLALGALAIASTAFLPMWSDWLAAVLDARGPYSGLLYSLKDVPMMLIPLIAWVTTRSG